MYICHMRYIFPLFEPYTDFKGYFIVSFLFYNDNLTYPFSPLILFLFMKSIFRKPWISWFKFRAASMKKKYCKMISSNPPSKAKGTAFHFLHVYMFIFIIDIIGIKSEILGSLLKLCKVSEQNFFLFWVFCT